MSTAPIYTEKSECQDCFKCLRECPVKAIKVQGGCATLVAEYCIYCGHCVEVCPNGAKKVRDDVTIARKLLETTPRMIASLAPSFVCEFPGVSTQQLIAAIRKLGFWGVSETALGAQLVSAYTKSELETRNGDVLFSTACPAVVEYIRKYHAKEAPHLVNMLSPLLTHCKLLRQIYGDDLGIVFIGPCIAKKREADARGDILDIALTFEELRTWFDQEKINPATLTPTFDDRFVPEDARSGALYPVEGGMNASIAAEGETQTRFMSFSGLPSIRQAISQIDGWHPQVNVFVELLACSGGCVNGPKARRELSTVRKRYEILDYAKPGTSQQHSALSISETTPVTLPQRPQFTEPQIREALRSVGKLSAHDERNCGGCGYDSCREFAAALLDRKAERTMCATYMRQLAQRKANALISKMPSAAVIVNDELCVIDANPKFRAMVAADLDPVNTPATLENVPLAELVPFSYLFQRVMESGEDILDRDIRWKRKIVHLSIFTIEPNSVVGAVLQDITQSTMHKEQIIARAQEVIQKNLKTVQQIAFLLGENAAESEITLNTIVESFSPEEVEDDERG